MGKGPTRSQLSDSPVKVRRPVVPTLPPTEIEEKGHVTFFETVNIVKPERDVRTSADTSRFPVLLSMPPRIHIDKRHLRTPVEGNPIDAGEISTAPTWALVDEAKAERRGTPRSTARPIGGRGSEDPPDTLMNHRGSDWLEAIERQIVNLQLAQVGAGNKGISRTIRQRYNESLVAARDSARRRRHYEKQPNYLEIGGAPCALDSYRPFVHPAKTMTPREYEFNRPYHRRHDEAVMSVEQLRPF